MMITFHRSSSLGTLEFCEMKYFFQYVLGKKDKTNKKAVLGTIFHRAMQVLADKKIAQRDKKKKLENDDIRDMTFAECDDIDHITEVCFNYYKEYEKDVDLLPADLKTCIKWVYKAIAYNDGALDPRNQDVYATELFFDFQIKKPWAKYHYEIQGKVFEGYLGIKGTVDLIVQENSAYFQILDYKGLPLETPILTTLGWSTMGDIQIGDVVYDRFGEQTKVTAKSRIKNKECYKITFDDKSTAECDDEHYWTLSDNSVIQTPDLQKGMKIDVARPIKNEDIDLPIHPYVLGLWLGDGRNRGGEICSGDLECFEHIKKCGYFIGENIDKRKRNCESRTIYGLTKELRDLNLLHNKHIPNIYFKGSYNQRLALLQGLMDSDGSVNPIRKQCVFMNRKERLSNDVQFLLRTLGQRPYLCITKQKYKDKDIECYPVFFRPINDIKPFLLERKNNKIDNKWGGGQSDTRRIINIEKIGIKKTQCISVDSNDKTYLCTENLIPTHNTGKRLNWATDKPKEYEDLQNDKQLLLYYYALKNEFPDKEFYVSIYYVNDGGVFDFAFGDEEYEKAEKMLRSRFEYIRSVGTPKQLSPQQKHWKCQKLCKFSEFDKKAGKSTCNVFHDMIKSKGIHYVTEKYADVNKFGTYGDGGGRIAEQDTGTD